jgi:hypothetical protein
MNLRKAKTSSQSVIKLAKEWEIKTHPVRSTEIAFTTR